MSARNRVKDKAPTFKGQKSALPIESYGISNAEQIKNLYLKSGQLNKIHGSSDYAEILLTQTGGVAALIGWNDLLIAQRGLSLALNVVTLDQNFENTGSIPLTSAKKMQSASWRDRLVLSNSQDALQLLYKYTSTGLSITGFNFGIDPPAALNPATITTDGGGNVDGGDSYYMITLYDSETNSESPCGGAKASVDGVFELSPNGFLGPTPALYTNVGASKVQISYAGIIAIIDANTAAGNGRATHFIIYRSGAKVNGLYDSFFRVPLKNGGSMDANVLIDINTFRSELTPFTDNTAHASLPAVSPPDNNSPPPTPTRLFAALTYAKSTYSSIENWTKADVSGFRHMRFFRDQLFGVGAVSYGFTVTRDVALGADITQKVTGNLTQFRDLLHASEVFQPDYWPYRWEVGRGDGQETIGLGVLGDVALLVFKEAGAYYLSGSSPDNFVVRVMDTQKGAIHQNTIQETPVGVITLDRSGFVLWNKIGQGVRISEDIFDLIKQINFIYASNFYSSYDAQKNLYRCSVLLSGVGSAFTTPTTTFILSLDTMEWSIESGTEGLSRAQFSISSNNFSSHADPTIFDGVTAPTISVDTGRVYDFVGSATNGKIYDYSSDQAVTNRGSAIESVWTSGTINFGDDQHKKRMNWVYLRAKSRNGWKVNIEVIPDYDESRKYVIENWDVVGSQSSWYSSDVAVDGSLLWDSGTGSGDGGSWASDGQTRQVSKIPIKCIGYTFQIRIIHKETDPLRYGFAMESVSAEGCLLGR